MAIEHNGNYREKYLFTGKERDEETGLDYFGARYYDSRLGFWMSVDPLANKYPNVTPYLYCNGNPVMLIDPDGRAAVVNDEGQILGVVDNDDRAIYYASNDWTEKQGTNNLEMVGFMIGNNEFYKSLKENNHPAVGLFYSKASISADFSVGIQGGWKLENGPFKGLSLMANLVSVDLLSIDYSADKGTNLGYIGENGLKNISQELSLGCVVGIGLGQEFTTKGYGYESQESWYNCLLSVKQDGTKKTWTGSLDLNYSAAVLFGVSVTASIPLTYKR